MLLSVENYTLTKRFGFKKSIEMIKNAGFDAFDLSCYGMEESALLGNDYIEVAKGYRKIIEKNQLICNQAHASFTFTYGMEMDDSCPDYVYIKRSIAVAGILGARNIIVHSIQVPDGVDLVEYNLKFYKSLEPLCKEYNIHISVENLYYCINGRPWDRLDTPHAITEFVEKLNSPWFNVCLDVSHAALTGTMPEDFISGMESSLLKALHVHDCNYLEDVHWIPFTGDLHWDKITKALATIGYDGDLTLEVLGALNKYSDDLLPTALKFAEAIGRKLMKDIENHKN